MVLEIRASVQTNPVAVFAKENENTREEPIRALTLSHLTAIYIKQSLGAPSAPLRLCCGKYWFQLWYYLSDGRQLY